MKFLSIFFITTILLTPASAESVTRQITIGENKMEITLTPSPYDNFSFPGYFVIENLPSHTAFINTTADWYKVDGFTLSMLRLSPSSTNYTIKYYITTPKEKGNYSIYGTYKNKLRGSGEIPVQFINIDSDTPTSKGDASWVPSPSSTTVSTPISKEIITTTNQSQPSNNLTQQKQLFSGGIYIIFFSLIFLIGLWRLAPKPNQKEYEFTKEFIKRHGGANHIR